MNLCLFGCLFYILLITNCNFTIWWKQWKWFTLIFMFLLLYISPQPSRCFLCSVCDVLMMTLLMCNPLTPKALSALWSNRNAKPLQLTTMGLLPPCFGIHLPDKYTHKQKAYLAIFLLKASSIQSSHGTVKLQQDHLLHCFWLVWSLHWFLESSDQLSAASLVLLPAAPHCLTWALLCHNIKCHNIS